MTDPSPEGDRAPAQPTEPSELANLRRLHQGLTDALAACIDRKGRLIDPADGKPTPTDHYAHTFTALTIASRDITDPRWPELLRAYARIPADRKGHAPFNRLALELIRCVSGSHPGNQQRDELVDQALRSITDRGSYGANNWYILAGLADLVGAQSAAERRTAATHLTALADRWTTEAGGFIDFPETPNGDNVSTPIAYHAKYVLCLQIAVSLTASPALTRHLDAGLGWLLAFADDSGVCGGFGRSNHALFGYGAQLAVFTQRLTWAANAEDRRFWAHRCCKLRERLESCLRPDGLLSITLNPATGRNGGWDPYMHLGVYNAWAAGLLGWVLHTAHSEPSGQFHQAHGPTSASPANHLQPETFHDRRAGLLALRAHGATAALSTHGQPVQSAQWRDIDLRYGAMLPFHLTWQGRNIIGPPARLPALSLLKRPVMAGWLPLFESGGALYRLAFARPPSVQLDAGQALVCASGSLVLAHPGRRRLGLGARLARHLHAESAVRAPHASLPDHCATQILWIDLATGHLASVLFLHGHSASRVRLVNPVGHTLTRDQADRICCRIKRQSAHSGESVEVNQLRTSPYPCSISGAFARALPTETWPSNDTLWGLTLSLNQSTADVHDPITWHPASRALRTPFGEVDPAT